MIFNKSERDQIQETIKQATSSNEGVIIPAFIPTSQSYSNAHYRLSLLLAIIFPLLISLIPIFNLTKFELFFVPMISAILGYFLGFLPYLKRLFSTKSELRAGVHQKALQIFSEQQVHDTPERSAIFILVSRFEKRIELIADVGINKKVPTETWDHLISEFLKPQKESHKWTNSNVLTSLIGLIQSCGDLFDQYFPSHDTPDSEPDQEKENDEKVANESQETSEITNTRPGN